MERITSRQNPLIAQLRKLGSSRACRRETGRFLCEGPKLMSEAIRWGAEIETVLITDEAEVPPAVGQGARLVCVPDDLLRAVSGLDSPQGVLAVCRIPDCTPPEALPHGRYLVLDGVQDPGNVGTIWRTADALGADGLFLLPGCADPWSPKVVRSTMGACFRLNAWEIELENLSALLAAADIPLCATALRSDTEDIRSVELSCCAVVIGSEGRGISGEVLSRCRRTIKIPMRERCESLNAAVAAAVVLWEAARMEN